MVYIFLAEGFEEIEALTQIDLLRRADIEVTSVGIGGISVIGSHGIEVKCDTDFDNLLCNDAEMLILPGGMPGVNNLYNCKKLCELIKAEYEKGVYVSAICAAPLILGRLGISENHSMVCYPGFEHELFGAFVSEEPVVTDGNIITAKAAGSAIDFANAIITAIKGCEVAESVLDGIYYGK